MTGDTGDTEIKEGKFSGISSIPLKEQKQYRVSSVSPVTLYRIGLNVTCLVELAFRLMCNGNWEKNQLKRWMGERVEDAMETLVELEKEENTVH